MWTVAITLVSDAPASPPAYYLQEGHLKRRGWVPYSEAIHGWNYILSPIMTNKSQAIFFLLTVFRVT